MESRPKNPKFRNNPENFHPWLYDNLEIPLFKKIILSIKLKAYGPAHNILHRQAVKAQTSMHTCPSLLAYTK